MNASGDAAEQIVRISLQGIEVTGKMTADAAERLIKLIAAASKSAKENPTPVKTKGKTSLESIVRTKKPVKVFEVKDEDLKMFCSQAKKYGILYHVIKDKKSNDGKCDIMIRAEDAPKVNRIFERFKLGAVDKAEVTITEPKREDIKSSPEHERPPKSSKSAEEKFVDALFERPDKEKNSAENPSAAKTEKSRPSEPSSKSKNNINRDNQRPSVKAQLNDIVKEQKANATPKVPTKGAKTNVRT